MTKIFFVGLILMSSLSYAGGEWYEKGNGGFVLQCPSSPLRALDLYELESRYKDQMTLDRQHSTNLKERVEYLISKIERLNSQRAEKYHTWYSTYDQETEYVSGAQFDRLGDLGLVYIPDNCKLSQIVFRREPSIFNKARYTINKDLWDHLAPLDQAAMVMHELIYREFSGPPNLHQTSEPSRYFNALINSAELLTMPLDKYLGILQQLKVTSMGYSQLSPAWAPQWSSLKAYWPMSGPVAAIDAGSVLQDYFGTSDGVSSGAGMFYGNDNLTQGVSFDGINYFSIPQTSPANVCTAMTWMTWVKWNAPDDSRFRTLITNWSGCGKDAAWNVIQNGESKRVQATFNTTTGVNQWMSSSSSPFDGSWHHIALTLTAAGSATLYVDGVREATLSVSMGAGICSPTASMLIGGSQCSPSMGRGGILDEMAIWSTPLTAAEITAIYNRQKNSF